MKPLALLFAFAAVCGAANAGQVVIADFDDLPAYAGVGYHYPGMYLTGTADPQSWARSAPNVAYCGSGSQYRFPSGAVWVSFYEGGVGSIVVYGVDGGWLDLVDVERDLWTRVDLRYDQPIGSLDIIAHSGLMGFYYLDDFSYEIVPEPASLAGLGLGLVGLVGWRGRGRRLTA